MDLRSLPYYAPIIGWINKYSMGVRDVEVFLSARQGIKQMAYHPLTGQEL